MDNLRLEKFKKISEACKKKTSCAECPMYSKEGYTLVKGCNKCHCTLWALANEMWDKPKYWRMNRIEKILKD